MSRGPDAQTRLLRAIDADALAHGCTLTLSDARSQRWASATFTGARHRVTAQAADDAALAAFLCGIEEREFDLRDQLLADIAVDAVVRDAGQATVTLSALTLERD